MTPERHHHRPRLAAAALLLLLALPACTLGVRLVGQYDEVVDRATTDLQSRTTAFFWRMRQAPDTPWDSVAGFYADARGDAAGLVMRAAILEEGLSHTPLTDNFRRLLEQYDDAETLHRAPGPRSAELWDDVGSAFDQGFRAILTHLLYLKRTGEPPRS